MIQLKTTNRIEFLDRFCCGHDGLILAISVTYPRGRDPSIVVDLSLLDKCIPVDGTTSTLRLVFNDVSSYRFDDKDNYTLAVMTHGLQFVFANNRVGVDFGTLPDSPKRLSDFRCSEAFIVAASVSWTVVEPNDGEASG